MSHVTPVQTRASAAGSNWPPLERGDTPQGNPWFYLHEHREDRRKWEGKPTSVPEARVCELRGKTTTAGTSSMINASPASSGHVLRQNQRANVSSDPPGCTFTAAGVSSEHPEGPCLQPGGESSTGLCWAGWIQGWPSRSQHCKAWSQCTGAMETHRGRIQAFSSEERSSLGSRTWLWSSQGEHSACESFSLFYTCVINIAAVFLIVFYLTAVASKLLLSQPVIFIFCASNSPLPLLGMGMGVLVGALKGRMLFLNQDSPPFKPPASGQQCPSTSSLPLWAVRAWTQQQERLSIIQDWPFSPGVLNRPFQPAHREVLGAKERQV